MTRADINGVAVVPLVQAKWVLETAEAIEVKEDAMPVEVDKDISLATVREM